MSLCSMLWHWFCWLTPLKENKGVNQFVFFSKLDYFITVYNFIIVEGRFKLNKTQHFTPFTVWHINLGVKWVPLCCKLDNLRALEKMCTLLKRPSLQKRVRVKCQYRNSFGLHHEYEWNGCFVAIAEWINIREYIDCSLAWHWHGWPFLVE